MFSVSITHNSKIKELSDGNWVTDHESWSLNKWSSVGPTSFGSWVMKTGWYHSKLSSSKQGLNLFVLVKFLGSPSCMFMLCFFFFWVNKVLFGWVSFEWYDFVFITHHPKFVGPMEIFFVWTPSLMIYDSVSITQFFDFWVMSYGNWKHILAVFSFHNS